MRIPEPMGCLVMYVFRNFHVNNLDVNFVLLQFFCLELAIFC